MKPTSIIFIILAAVLVVSGIVVCIVGASMTDAQQPLLCDRIDEEGNEIIEYSLDEYKLNNIVIDIKNTDVRVVMGTESKIEFRNINKTTYDFVINNHKLSLSTVNPFEITSMDSLFRENSSGFDGIRHYLYLNRYKGKLSEVIITLTPEQTISDINISTKKGDINIVGLIGNAKCQFEATKGGNIVLENTELTNELNVKVKDGNFTLNRSSASYISFTVDNGDGKLEIAKQFNICCKCENGDVMLDGNKVQSDWTGVYPETLAEQEAERIDIVMAEVISGNLFIDTAE